MHSSHDMGSFEAFRSCAPEMIFCVNEMAKFKKSETRSDKEQGTRADFGAIGPG
jgi:hypothetical protein